MTASRMSKPQIIVYVSITLLSAIAIFYSLSDSQHEQLPLVQDTRGNITDEEFARIKQTIQDAQTKYTAANIQNIAAFVAYNTQNLTVGVKYSVYVHEGPLKQIAPNGTYCFYNKYMWLVNYGKYGFTYSIMGIASFYCGTKNQFDGGSNITQFGSNYTAGDQHAILAVLDNAAIYKGNDMMNNSIYIQQKLRIAFNSNWVIVIADPTKRYGFHICKQAGEKWFALKDHGSFKWNYIGTPY